MMHNEYMYFIVGAVFTLIFFLPFRQEWFSALGAALVGAVVVLCITIYLNLGQAWGWTAFGCWVAGAAFCASIIRALRDKSKS